MGQFAFETRKWIESQIKQRKYLVRNNCNHKKPQEVNKALAELETMLNAYPFDNDLNMARFVNRQIHNIETILPGLGSTSHGKRMRELSQINKKAVALIDRNIKTQKLIEYEIAF